jgi:hypothetical protein
MGYEKPQSGYALYAVFLPPFLQDLETLHFPLSGLQKRHIQPERYVQFGLLYILF